MTKYKFGDYTREEADLFKKNKVHRKSVIRDIFIYSVLGVFCLGFLSRTSILDNLIGKNTEKIETNTKEIVYLKEDMSDLQKQVGGFEGLVKDSIDDIDFVSICYSYGNCFYSFDLNNKTCSFNGFSSFNNLSGYDDGVSLGSSFYKKSLVDFTIPSEVFGFSVVAIGKDAFRGCTSLTNVVIPDSVVMIDNSAFRGCTSLTSVEIPESVNIICEEAFFWCTNLRSIKIPDNVRTIGAYAFRGCTELTSVEISNSLMILGTNAFSGCTGLTSIEIPTSVNSIGNNAFYDCTNLESIKLPRKFESEISNFSLVGSCEIIYID